MNAPAFAVRSADRRELLVYDDAGNKVGCAVGDVAEDTLRRTWPTLGEIIDLQAELEADLPMAHRGQPVCPTCAFPSRCRRPGMICGLYCIPVKDLTIEHVSPPEHAEHAGGEGVIDADFEEALPPPDFLSQGDREDKS